MPEDVPPQMAENRVTRNQKQSQTLDGKKPRHPHLYSSQEHIDYKGSCTAGRSPESLPPQSNKIRRKFAASQSKEPKESHPLASTDPQIVEHGGYQSGIRANTIQQKHKTPIDKSKKLSQSVTVSKGDTIEAAVIDGT